MENKIRIAHKSFNSNKGEKKSDLSQKKVSRDKSSRHHSRRKKFGRNADAPRKLPAPRELPRLSELPGAPKVVERNLHVISRKNIDYDALQVMYRLIRNGFRTFMVGGAVRDLLLGITPKDVDVATEAKPEEVRRIFRNSRIIGRRFRLAHVFFRDNKTIEVSTFRRDAVPALSEETEVIAEDQAAPDAKPSVGDDNTFGNPETDAWRRDITINGLFYDLSNFSVIDYVGGLDDLEKNVIRIIGKAEERFIEDPVRMMRVVRHSAKTKFKIDKETYKAICSNASRIALCPQTRVFEEFLREMKHGSSLESFKLMMDTGLLSFLFPALHEVVTSDKVLYKKLEFTLKQMSELAREGHDLPQSVLFAALVIGIMHGEPKAAAASEGAVGRIGLFQVWAESPFKEYYEHDFKQPTALPNIDFNKFMNRIKSGYLRSTTKEQFAALGVSKKECDKMEQILITRLLMFESYYGSTSAHGLEHRRGFEPAVQLLRLTARDKYAKDCLEYWQKKLK